MKIFNPLNSFKKITPFLALLFFQMLFYACGNQETTSNGDVQQFGKGKSDHVENVTEDKIDTSDVGSSDTIIIDTSSYYGKKLWVFSDILKEYDSIPKQKSTIFSRFSHSRSFTLFLRKKQTVKYGKTTLVYPEVNVFYYEFKDSVAAHNAIYNWLDCLGDCQQVKIGEDTATIKSPPMMACFSENEVLLLEFYCEHKANDWKNLKKQVQKLMSEKPYAVMDVKCGGPLKWELSEEFKKNRIEKEENIKTKSDSLESVDP